MFWRRREATVREFGLVSGLRAVGASLLSVRGADVKGSVGVAKGRGEDIRRARVTARDEPRDLHLSRAVTSLSCCVYQRSDRAVSARSLAHRAAGRVGHARVEGSVLAGCTRHGFARPGAAQGQADRVDVLLGLHHGAVMWVSPRPRVIDLGVSQVPAAARERPRSPPARASGAGQNARSCPRKVVMRAWIFKRSACQGVLLVSIAVVRSDASGVPKGRREWAGPA